MSVATAYRYFPNTRSLQVDGTVARRHNMPDYDAVLAAAGDDLVERIAALVRAIATWQLSDEAVWRRVQQATLERWFAQVEALITTRDAAQLSPRRPPRRWSGRPALWLRAQNLARRRPD